MRITDSGRLASTLYQYTYYVLTTLSAQGLMPEMVAAVSKIMRNQDLVLGARKAHVVTKFRNTIGLPATCRSDCSPTIRPTTKRALQLRSSMA